MSLEPPQKKTKVDHDREAEKRTFQDLNNRLELYILWLRQKDAEVKDYERVLEKLREELKDKTVALGTLQFEKERLAAENKMLLDKLASAEALKGELEGLRKRNEELRGENDVLRNEVRDLKKENARQRAEIKALEDTINGLRGDLRGLEKKIEDMKTERSVLLQQLEKLKELLKQLQADYHQLSLTDKEKELLATIAELKISLETKEIDLRKEFGEQLFEAVKEIQEKYIKLLDEAEEKIMELEKKLKMAIQAPTGCQDPEHERLILAYAKLDAMHKQLLIDFDKERKCHKEHLEVIVRIQADLKLVTEISDGRQQELMAAKARIAELENQPKPKPERRVELRQAPFKPLTAEMKAYQLLVESEEERAEPAGYISPPHVPNQGVQLEVSVKDGTVNVRNTSKEGKDIRGWKIVNITTTQRFDLPSKSLAPGKFLQVVFGTIFDKEPQGCAGRIVFEDTSLTVEDNFQLLDDNNEVVHRRSAGVPPFQNSD